MRLHYMCHPLISQGPVGPWSLFSLYRHVKGSPFPRVTLLTATATSFALGEMSFSSLPSLQGHQ